MTKKGEVDFFLGTQGYEEWMKSSEPFYKTFTAMFSYQTQKFFPNAEMKIGIIGNDYALNLKRHYLNADIKIYDEYKSAFYDLIQQKIDFVYDDKLAVNRYILINNLVNVQRVLNPNVLEEQRTVQAISNNQKKIEIFNKGLHKIDYSELVAVEKKWVFNENDKYFFKSVSKKIILNEEEKRFIKGTTIKVSVSDAWAPMVFRKKRAKVPSGIAFEVWQMIVEKLGLKVEYIFSKSYKEQIRALKEKKVDLIFSAAITPDMLQYTLFSKDFLKFPISIATDKDENFLEDSSELSGKKVAIIEDSVAHKILSRAHLDIDFILVNNQKEGLEKVSHKEAFAYVDLKPNLIYAINSFGYENLKVSGNTGPFYDMRVMVRNDYSVLMSAINKALYTVSSNKINAITDEWLNASHGTYINKKFLYYVFLGFIILLVIFSLFYSSVRKINERLKYLVEQKTAELNNFLQVIEQSNVSIIMTNLEGTIIYANNYATQATGYSLKELIGNNPRILKSGQQSNEFYKELWDTVLSGKTWNGEFANKTKSGKIFYESAVVTPIFDAKGHIQFLAAVKENITDKVEARIKLQVAQDEAISANKAKSIFLANMSHEIRTPMNAVLGMTYLLEQTALNTNQLGFLHKIESAAKNLLGVINDILDFSKIEAGRLVLEKHLFNLEEVLQNVFNLFSLEAERKNLELLIDLDTDVPKHYFGDSLRLSQVLTNLLSNAVKFTQQGEIKLSIQASKSKENLVTLVFHVIDTGIGLHKEELERLFVSFSQADSSTTRKYGGTGLGLAITKEIVEMMQGEVGVKSEYGKGSDFYFSVQLQEEKYEKTKESLLDIKILVVDDNISSLEILEKMLKSLCLHVKALSSGQEAIDEVVVTNNTQIPYDLIFLDCKMPRIDGLSVVKELNKKSLLTKPLFIMLGSSSSENFKIDMSYYNIVDFLGKPLTISTLNDAIMGTLEKGMMKKYKNQVKTNTLVHYFHMLSGAKILVVEDNAQNIEVTQEFLTKANVTSEIARNGKEAIEKIKTNFYDGVLMDCQMPIMDGYVATEKIRKLGFVTLPIIAMTANVLESDKQKCFESGMNDYIQKPIDTIKFYKVLSLWIKPAHQEAFEEQITLDNSSFLLDLTLDELNISLGLSRVAHDEKLFVKQLKGFKKYEEKFQKEIHHAYRQGELKNVTRLVHTLKGLSGTIGAEKLFEAIQRAEIDLQKNGFSSLFQSNIDLILKHLEKVIKDIEHILEEYEKKQTALHVTTSLTDIQFYKALERVKKMILDLDTQALDEVEKVYQEFVKRGFDQEVNQIMQFLNDFEFEKAENVLHIVLSKKKSNSFFF